MVEKSDADVQQYYIDGEELNAFLESEELNVTGIAYSWEGEGVTHLRFKPLAHAFGIVSVVSFAKHNGKHPEAIECKVDIDKDGNAVINGIKANIIPAHKDLYSRSKGLLEVDVLSTKRVLIMGLGSGGAPIALELAKAGVGEFAISDFDRLEPHNLVRHVCYVNDLGRLKTDAIEDAIKGKNPYAKVDKYPIDLTANIDILRQEVDKCDLVICGTDNSKSRYILSKLLIELGKPAIFGGCVTRAEGGDVFIYRPGAACYFCLVGMGVIDVANEELSDLKSARKAGKIAEYQTDQDVEAKIQVGLSSDIEPISNMMTKLALVELSRGTDSGISSLERELTCNHYFWANRRDRLYSSFCKENIENVKVPTILRWYGGTIDKHPECSVCGQITEQFNDSMAIDNLVELEKLKKAFRDELTKARTQNESRTE